MGRFFIFLYTFYLFYYHSIFNYGIFFVWIDIHGVTMRGIEATTIARDLTLTDQEKVIALKENIEKLEEEDAITPLILITLHHALPVVEVEEAVA